MKFRRRPSTLAAVAATFVFSMTPDYGRVAAADPRDEDFERHFLVESYNVRSWREFLNEKLFRNTTPDEASKVLGPVSKATGRYKLPDGAYALAFRLDDFQEAQVEFSSDQRIKCWRLCRQTGGWIKTPDGEILTRTFRPIFEDYFLRERLVEPADKKTELPNKPEKRATAEWHRFLKKGLNSRTTPAEVGKLLGPLSIDTSRYGTGGLGGYELVFRVDDYHELRVNFSREEEIGHFSIRRQTDGLLKSYRGELGNYSSETILNDFPTYRAPDVNDDPPKR